MPIPFAKYSGCGNDFILIDNREHILGDCPPPEYIARLCHRQKGIGADGIVLLERSKRGDFRMRIFNSDGSEAEMCGNGIRCLARFIHDLGFPQKNLTIETMHQIIHTSLKPDGTVQVRMPPAIEHAYSVQIEVNNHNYIVHHIDTGVPHAVLFVEDIEDSAHMTLAPRIRHHPKFYPKGSNVNFVKLLPDQTISVRTYERGVEAETLACGTGAAASAVATARIHRLAGPIQVRTRSGDILTIGFNDGLQMTGPAIKNFSGVF